MTIDDKIRDEKLQYIINRETAKILALSSEKIDKYEYLTGEEILPSDQRIVIQRRPSAHSFTLKYLFLSGKGMLIFETKLVCYSN